MFEMNMCFRIEMAVVVVVHFFCMILTFLWLQCLGFHISPRLYTALMICSSLATNTPGHAKQIINTGSLPGASHSLALGVLSGAMRPVRTAVLQTTGWFWLVSCLPSSNMRHAKRSALGVHVCDCTACA
jgi:hypothetical protein